MKNAVFWDVAPCRSCVNRRFGGTYRQVPSAHAGSSFADFSTLKMEATRSSDSSVNNKIYTAPHPRRRHFSNFVLVSYKINPSRTKIRSLPQRDVIRNALIRKPLFFTTLKRISIITGYRLDNSDILGKGRYFSFWRCLHTSIAIQSVTHEMGPEG
jgi:hypothetical protein